MHSAEASNELRSVSFREYEERDFPFLCRLDTICFAPGIAYEAEEIAAALMQPTTFAIVAEKGDEIIAFILAGADRGGGGHIITIDVHPEWRSRGVGMQLMAKAEVRLAQQLARRVVLEVSVANAPAIAFYQRLGYSRERLLRHYYRDGSDAYRMGKAL
jgi:ribosomal-protein-alanine N-acetyltransferase